MEGKWETKDEDSGQGRGRKRCSFNICWLSGTNNNTILQEGVQSIYEYPTNATLQLERFFFKGNSKLIFLGENEKKLFGN